MNGLTVSGLLAIGAVACYPQECEKSCTRLERCGLLPSPLGVAAESDPGLTSEGPPASAKTDCLDRCEESGKAREVVARCEERAQASVGPFDWCITSPENSYTHYQRERLDPGSRHDKAAPESGCDVMARCLAATFGNRVLGKASFELIPTVGQATVLKEDLTCELAERDPAWESAKLFGLDFSDFDLLRASAICSMLDVDRAVHYYESSGRRIVIDQGTCEWGVMTASTAVDVVPGPITAGIRLFRHTSDGLERACWNLYSKRTILVAGPGAVPIWVNVPPIPELGTLVPCEGLPIACTDGADNDADGLIDDADLDCHSPLEDTE